MVVFQYIFLVMFALFKGGQRKPKEAICGQEDRAHEALPQPGQDEEQWVGRLGSVVLRRPQDRHAAIHRGSR